MTAFTFRSILECNVLISTLQLVLVGLDAHKVSALEVNLEAYTILGLGKLFELEVEDVEYGSDFSFRILQNVFEEGGFYLILCELCYYVYHIVVKLGSGNNPGSNC